MSTLLDRLVAKTGKPYAHNSAIAKMVYREGVGDSDELRRIRALPERVLDVASTPDLSPVYVHTDFCGVEGCDVCATGPARLWPLQSAILFEAEKAGGALGALPCGGGKTLTSLLLCDAVGAKRAMVLVPSDVIDQLIHEDLPRLTRHFRIPIERIKIASYNQLSIARTADMLHNYRPDLLVLDEAHMLKNPKTARGIRYRDYLKEQPSTMVVPMSGTMTVRSPREYAHLADHALRAGSPVPRTYKVVEEWSFAIDAEAEDPMPPGKLLGFCDDATLKDLSDGKIDGRTAARLGFQRRQSLTLGFVGSEGADVAASIAIGPRPVSVPGVVLDKMRDVSKMWCVDGEEIDEAARMAAILRQLSCGFYYVWDWPRGIVDKEWLDARAAWNKAVRDQLAHPRRGLDSPLLVARAVQRGELRSILPEWRAWDAVRGRWHPTPPTKPVWLSNFLVDDSVAWIDEVLDAPEDGGGILWFSHVAVEHEVRKEAARRTGTGRAFAVFAAGESADLIAVANGPRRSAPRVIACSVRCHHKGKNLQAHWSRNLVMSWPANGKIVEQLISRTHRPGQRADVVEVLGHMHTDINVTSWLKTLADARYVLETQRARQKVLIASHRGMSMDRVERSTDESEGE